MQINERSTVDKFKMVRELKNRIKNSRIAKLQDLKDLEYLMKNLIDCIQLTY